MGKGGGKEKENDEGIKSIAETNGLGRAKAAVKSFGSDNRIAEKTGFSHGRRGGLPRDFPKIAGGKVPRGEKERTFPKDDHVMHRREEL
jgi:hypothetical protein